MDMQDATRGIALELDDDLPRPIGVEAIDGWVPGSGERSITISLPSEDTSGQILRDPRTIDVVVIGDDTEGHSLSLRFPNSQDAGEFRRRLMLTGALAGTLVVGSITASTAMNQSANSVGIGAQPAAVQAAPAPPADQVTSTSEYAVSHDGAVAAPAVDSAPLTSEYAASHNGAVTAPAVDSAPLTSEYAASHNGAVTAPAVDSAPLTSEYAASHGTGAAGTAAVSSGSLTSEYAAPHGTVLTGDVPIPSTTLTSEYAASHGSGAEVTAPVDPGSLTSEYAASHGSGAEVTAPVDPGSLTSEYAASHDAAATGSAADGAVSGPPVADRVASDNASELGVAKHARGPVRGR